MAFYRYRCDTDGLHDVSRPIGTAKNREPCPVCSEPSSRVFTSPMVSMTPRGVVSAMDRAEKSADLPEVVGALPGSARAPTSRRYNPAWNSLPRP